MNAGGFVAGFVTIYAIVTFLVHTAFAFAVDSDARRIKRSGGGLVFVGPFVWAFATFIGGPIVAVAYWVVHHSALRSERKWPPNNGGSSG
jgi:cytochrome c biogenesis protein CcdA